MPVSYKKKGEFFIGKEITDYYIKDIIHHKKVPDSKINNKLQKLSQDQRSIIPRI